MPPNSMLEPAILPPRADIAADAGSGRSARTERLALKLTEGAPPEFGKGPSPTVVSGRAEMRTSDHVSGMLALKACGWGSKRIAAALGCSRNTVKRWLAESGWCAARPRGGPGRAMVSRHGWANGSARIPAMPTLSGRNSRRGEAGGKEQPRGVDQVKKNAVAGRHFGNFAALEAHLVAWTREVADARVHGTAGEAPLSRFDRDEAPVLRPAAGIPPFPASRELMRKVTSDCSVEVDGNAYSVPWTLIDERLTVIVAGPDLRVQHSGQDVARHALRSGRHGRVADPAHLAGIGRRRAICPTRTCRHCCGRRASMTLSREGPGGAAQSSRPPGPDADPPEADGHPGSARQLAR